MLNQATYYYQGSIVHVALHFNMPCYSVMLNFLVDIGRPLTTLASLVAKTFCVTFTLIAITTPTTQYIPTANDNTIMYFDYYCVIHNYVSTVFS